MVTCGVAVAKAEGDGVGVAAGDGERAGAPAWVAPHALRAMASIGAISRPAEARIVAGRIL